MYSALAKAAVAAAWVVAADKGAKVRMSIEVQGAQRRGWFSCSGS